MGKVSKFLMAAGKAFITVGAAFLIAVFVWVTIQNYTAIQDLRVNVRYYNHALYLLADYLATMKADNLDNLKRDIKIVEAINTLVKNQDIPDKNNQALADAVNTIVEYLNNAPQITDAQKRIKELGLLQINVMIKNMTKGALGSGATIKYNDKYYILSVAHLVDDANKDKLELWENGEKVCDLKIVKMDKSIDMCLFAPVDDAIVPHVYTELADSEPGPSEEIYVVGNPMGIEDLLSDGRVIQYSNNYMYYIDHSYFGSSGGGIYNREGKVVGTIDFIMAPNPNPAGTITNVPSFVINGAVRLSVIKDFLQDVK